MPFSFIKLSVKNTRKLLKFDESARNDILVALILNDFYIALCTEKLVCISGGGRSRSRSRSPARRSSRSPGGFGRGTGKSSYI